MKSIPNTFFLLLGVTWCAALAAADAGAAWVAANFPTHSVVPLQVNIFGDGNPANGVEDDRIDMSSPDWNDPSRRSWNMGAGTIHCEGKNRGSAIILDTSSLGGPVTGMIVATSAHVVFDLEENRRFRSCRFHYMALDSLPGYQADIDLDASVLGPFKPGKDRRQPEFGKHDWAFLYVPSPSAGINGSGRIRLMPFESLSHVDQSRVSFQFIAYSRSSGSISISTRCSVAESTPQDLGGGAWRGQLLDNCDSEGGASGGGLVAAVDGQQFLVAIRSGAHWNSDAFPEKDYPRGPPDGSSWDVGSNTNFSRAIDLDLLDALARMVDRLSAETQTRGRL
ncbi:MAG: hypothetical protein HKO64_12100 [Xanthomonadales bacterium]|nr:hypothetical protein [Gammaproteobacteria bacterium]NNL96355.1 hypothetical protein [Xanthomonadales bacterium]